MWIWHSESERFMRNLIGIRDLENVLPIESVYEQISLKNPNGWEYYITVVFLSFLLLHCVDLIIVELQIKFCDLPKKWWRQKTLSKVLDPYIFKKRPRTTSEAMEVNAI